MAAKVNPIDRPRPGDAGAPSTASVTTEIERPPLPGASEAARDLVAALMHERALVADDMELRQMAGALLAAGHTIERTAEMLGLRPSTLWSWMADPVLRQAKREGVEYVRARVYEALLSGTLASAESLRRIVDDPLADAETKLKVFEALADRTGFGKPDKKGERQVIDVQFSRRLAVLAATGSVVVEEEADEEEGDEVETG